MADDLRTVATFTDPTSAAVARNRLEAAGIDACLSDDLTVATDFLLGNAIGWVKVQVRAGDVERAEAVLADRGPLVAEAVEPAGADDGPDEPEPPESADGRRVRHAWRAAVFGMALCPPLLHLYSLGLLLRVATSGRELSAADNRRFYAAFLLDALVLTAAGLLAFAR